MKRNLVTFNTRCCLCLRIPFATLLVLLTCIATAQKSYHLDLTSAEIKTGKTKSGEGLPATEFTFPDYLYDLHFDSVRNQVLVVLRETGDKKFKPKGSMAVIDLKTKEQKWAQKLQGDKFDYKITPGNIILNSTYQTVAYDWKDGKRKWIKPGSFVFIDPVNNICLSSGGVALDLNNGATKWQTKVNNKYGWQHLVSLGDTAILIAAGGIMKINLQTGKGWQYETKIGIDDYTVPVAGAAAGVAVGLLTGMMVVPTGGATQVSGTCSNILFDSGLVYFASREEIACLDMNGKLLWKTELPKKETGNSTIWKDGHAIYLLNNAYGSMGYRKVNKGSPYLAAFDAGTGKQRYLSDLGTLNMVSGSTLKDDTIFIHTTNRVYKYALASGEKLLAVNASDNKLDRHVQFASEKRNFVKTRDGSYKTLAEIYPKEKFLLGEHNATRVNAQLQHKGIITDPLWVLHGQYAGMDVLKNKNQLVFIKDGKPVAEFEVGNTTIYGDMLVDARETKLILVDLKNLSH
ncbi:MAG: hypothetical protein K0R82_151 [Flavipsychrobacter sp.]|nr:hypothetical protein [Flavipsychrobacter sp.]